MTREEPRRPAALHPGRVRPLAAVVGLVAASALGCVPPQGGSATSADATARPVAEPAPAAAGAGAAQTPTAGEAPSGAAPDGWPGSLFVWTDDEGVRLHLGPAADDVAFAAVRAGVPVVPAGALEGGRLPIRVPGTLEVYGWIPADRVGARAQRTCRVGGTPVYLGPNDEVQVLGPDPRGLTRVRVRPDMGRPGVQRLGPYEGVCPPDYFSAAVVAPGATEGPSPGTPMRLPAGQQVALYDRPGGDVVATLPGLTPPLTVVVLRDQDGWKGVRAGTGPYLVGFVDAPLTPEDAAPPASQPTRLPPASGGAGMPSDIAELRASSPVLRVRPGAEVTFADRTVARVTGAAWASEQRRYDTGGVDAYVAADERVTVRGLVNAEALEPLAPPAATTP